MPRGEKPEVDPFLHFHAAVAIVLADVRDGLSKAGPVQARAERHLLRKPLARVSRHRTNRMRKELQRRVNIERLPDQPHNARQNLQARADGETGRATWWDRVCQYR